MANGKPAWQDKSTPEGKKHQEWLKSISAPEGTAPWTPSEAPRFVHCDLTDEAKLALADWAEKQLDGDLLLWLEARVESGHTLSVRVNDVGYQCSLTGVKEGSPHYGQSLVARASSPARAMRACWYRDVIVLKEAWPIGKAYEKLDF